MEEDGERKARLRADETPKRRKGVWRIPDQHQVCRYPSWTAQVSCQIARLLLCKPRVNLNSLARLGTQISLAGAAIVSAEVHLDDRPGYGLLALTATSRPSGTVAGMALFGPTRFGRGHGAGGLSPRDHLVPEGGTGDAGRHCPVHREGFGKCHPIAHRGCPAAVAVLPSTVHMRPFPLTVRHHYAPDPDSLPMRPPLRLDQTPHGDSWRGLGGQVITHLPTRGIL